MRQIEDIKKKGPQIISFVIQVECLSPDKRALSVRLVLPRCTGFSVIGTNHALCANESSRHGVITDD